MWQRRTSTPFQEVQHLAETCVAMIVPSKPNKQLVISLRITVTTCGPAFCMIMNEAGADIYIVVPTTISYEKWDVRDGPLHRSSEYSTSVFQNQICLSSLEHILQATYLRLQSQRKMVPYKENCSTLPSRSPDDCWRHNQKVQ
jgi:hypothetical protein